MNLQEVKNIIRIILKEEFDSNIEIVPVDMEYAKDTWNIMYGGGEFGFDSILDYVDEGMSKSIMKDGEIIGVYLLGDTQLPEMLSYYDDFFSKDYGLTYKLEEGVDIESYKSKKGINGIHLYIEPEYRNKGIGKVLIEHAENLGDYIWGQHDLKLNNIENWLKRRKLIAKTYNKEKLDGYITST